MSEIVILNSCWDLVWLDWHSNTVDTVRDWQRGYEDLVDVEELPDQLAAVAVVVVAIVVVAVVVVVEIMEKSSGSYINLTVRSLVFKEHEEALFVVS